VIVHTIAQEQAQEDQADAEYETAARHHDARRHSTGGGLNASLNKRYRQLQHDRDEIQRAAQVAEEKEQDDDNGSDHDDKDDDEAFDQALQTAEGKDMMHEDNQPDEMEDNNNNTGGSILTSNSNSKKRSREQIGSSRNSSSRSSSSTAVATTTGSTTPVQKRASKLLTNTTSSSSKSTKKKKRQILMTKAGTRKRGSTTTTTDNGGVPTNHSANNSSDICEPIPRPSERYHDLGGMDEVLIQIRQLVEYPLCRPEVYRHLGVDPPRGVLLRGPPGCGKTHLVNSIAGQLNVPYFRVSAPELVSGMSGESEQRIRELFHAASDHAPAILFLDEIDAIAPKRSGDGKGMEKRMVAQLLTCLDMLAPQYNRAQAPVLVLGATNRPDSLDPALRRAGRFDKEILLGVPDEAARIQILTTMTKHMKIEETDGTFDIPRLARLTPGYVGADVRSLTKEAAVIAINRIFQNILVDTTNTNVQQQQEQDPTTNRICNLQQRMAMDDGDADPTTLDTRAPPPPVVPLTEQEMAGLYITMDDFLAAVPKVQPSSTREGFATVPGVSWEDIGALSAVREELTLSVLEPIRHPEHFKALGIPLPAGVLLYGPPGCGKTLLAKAIANESGANFISVKGPELLDKYVGESERSVRRVFERARASSPCVVFFDELDSLCPKRGGDSGGGSGNVSERVVNQLLTEMDGLESRRSVFVIAATNRPELIDPAMMRPGRLDKLLYVPLPSPEDRVSILKATSGNMKFSLDIDLDKIGMNPKADGYSGADCSALLREAGLAVLKERYDNATDNSSIPTDGSSSTSGISTSTSTSLCICPRHFDYAFAHVVPSVSRKDQARYHRIRDRMANARSRPASVPTTDTGDEAVAESKSADDQDEQRRKA